MKQIIPFKKELLFKTKVREVTSISLEYSVNDKREDMLIGNFVVSGDYKMTESSINREKFNFDIPFEISLDGTYDINSIKLDIDNFYYELVNDEILKVNIDVFLTGDEVEKAREVVDDKVETEEDNIEIEDNSSIKYNEVDNVNINSNIFDGADSGDTYVTYFVYVVKEEDTIDKILEKFNVSRDDLEKYNDISDIHEKMKIIIPNKNE